MAEELDYTTTSSKPIIIEVEKDGVEYSIKVAVAILGVSDTEKTDPKGMPVFQVQANLTVNTEKKE